MFPLNSKNVFYDVEKGQGFQSNSPLPSVLYLFIFRMRLLTIISILTDFISKQTTGSTNLSYWINVDSMWFIVLNILPLSHFLGWNPQTSLGDFFQFMADGQWPQDIKWTAVLLPFCTFLSFSLIPILSLPRYLYFFLFTDTPIIRDKGTNSLPIYGIPCYFQPLLDAHPFASFFPTPQHRTFIRSFAGRNIWKRNAKYVRFCQVPCQAALLSSGPRPYNLALVLRSGSFSRKTDPHLRQQVLSTAPPQPQQSGTQHYHPCCHSGFDLDLKVLEWPLPCPPAGFHLSNLHCGCWASKAVPHLLLAVSLPNDKVLPLDLPLSGFSNKLCSHSPLWYAPIPWLFLTCGLPPPQPPIW